MLFTHNVSAMVSCIRRYVVMVCSWEGNRLASHWSCVTDLGLYMVYSPNYKRR